MSAAFRPDGVQIASGGMDCTVRLWDVGSRKYMAELKRHTKIVTCVLYSPDGGTLATGSDDALVMLWSTWDAGEDVTPIAVLTGHHSAVQTLAWAPSGEQLASGSSDRSIKVCFRNA